MKLTEIAKGFYWDKNGKLYLSSIDEKYDLINEYLGNNSLQIIEEEIKKLSDFKIVKDTQNRIEIEKHIISSLQGFTQYDEGTYAYIAGAHDLTVTILYDLAKNKIFLKHPYASKIEVYEIEQLINLLFQIKTVREVLGVLG